MEFPATLAVRITTNDTTILNPGKSIVLKRVVVTDPGTAWVLEFKEGSGTLFSITPTVAGQVIEIDYKSHDTLSIVSSGTTPGDMTALLRDM